MCDKILVYCFQSQYFYKKTQVLYHLSMLKSMAVSAYWSSLMTNITPTYYILSSCNVDKGTKLSNGTNNLEDTTSSYILIQLSINSNNYQQDTKLGKTIFLICSCPPTLKKKKKKKKKN